MSLVVDPAVERVEGHKGVDGCSIQRVPAQRHEDPRGTSPIWIEPKQRLVVTVGARVDPIGIRGRMKVLHGRNVKQYSGTVAGIAFVVGYLEHEQAIVTSKRN